MKVGTSLRVAFLFVCAVFVFIVGQDRASAQSPPAQQSDSRPAATTTSGDTGLWFVPTGHVVLAKKWAVSFYNVNTDDGQGFTDVHRFPVSFAYGIGDRFEIFGNWSYIVRVDRDARPLFFTSTAGEANTGTGGGILPDYPLVHMGWSGNKMGDVWVGGKAKLLARRSTPLAIAVRAQTKLPTGDDAAGVSSGKADFQVDGIASYNNSRLELAGFGGVIVRGNPSGYELTNGVRWGAGAAFPNILSSGLRGTAELHGERYMNTTILAASGVVGADGSLAPAATILKNPTYLALGLTWQSSSGFFVGGGGSWNLAMSDRDQAAGPGVGPFGNVAGDKGAFHVRIGYSPGTRVRRAAAPPPPPSPPPAPTPAPAVLSVPATPPPPPPPPANRPPNVQAGCDPCRLEPGRTANVMADAQDPDGDALTYTWKAEAGIVESPAARVSRWISPESLGIVHFTVTVDDGKGGIARADTAIDVVLPPRREIKFGDVLFDFDRSTIRPDAVKILNEVVAAMIDDLDLRLEIDGHTCNIGTTPYNLALGQRRAVAVRDWLVKRGIAANRLKVMSYGEDKPKFDNSAEAMRKLNRRAELIVKLTSGKN